MQISGGLPATAWEEDGRQDVILHPNTEVALELCGKRSVPTPGRTEN